MSRPLLWVAGAAAFGFVMHSAASLAADPRWESLQWVVNWGALWAILPIVGGRLAGRAPAAALLGAVVAGTEIAVYYGTTSPAAYQLVWLVAGTLACAGVGVVGWLSRTRARGLLVIPMLMVLEPVGLTAVFLALGRELGTHWVLSCSVELVVGIVLALAILKRRTFIGA